MGGGHPLPGESSEEVGSCQLEQGGKQGPQRHVGTRGVKVSSRKLEVPRACRLMS